MKCLIVEDDPILQSTLRELLEDMGHDVCVAETLTMAKSAVLRHKFDLVLLDYRLPDGTSLDLSDQVGFSCPNSRIIMLTGANVFPMGEHLQLAPGVDWVLRKPVRLADLEAMVEYAAQDAKQRPTVATARI